MVGSGQPRGCYVVDMGPAREREKGDRCLDVAATGSAVWGDRLVVEVWGPSKGRRGSSEAVAPWGLLTSQSL